jgi:hypothetical protein
LKYITELGSSPVADDDRWSVPTFAGPSTDAKPFGWKIPGALRVSYE